MTVITNKKVYEIVKEFGVFDDNPDQFNITSDEDYRFYLWLDNGSLVAFEPGYKGLQDLLSEVMVRFFENRKKSEKTTELVNEARRSVIDYCIENGKQVQKEKAK